MIARAYGLLITGLFGASVVLWLSSCTQLGIRRFDDTEGASTERARWWGPHQRRIAQVLIDGRPTYAVCEEPACPVVTPKILVSELAQAGGQGPADVQAEDQSADQVVDRADAQSDALARTQAAVRSDVADGLAASASSPVTFAERPISDSSPTPVAMHPAAKAVDLLADPADRQTAVNFAADSAVLTVQAKHALDRAMPWARQADRIVILGRTDNLGSEPVNQRLAFARALAVREYIRDQIPLVNNVIAINARGACCFVASNATAQGRSRNRRVEVVFRGLRSQEAS